MLDQGSAKLGVTTPLGRETRRLQEERPRAVLVLVIVQLCHEILSFGDEKTTPTTYYKCERIATMPRRKGVSNQPAIQAVEAAALNVAAIRAKALLGPGGPCLTQENFARAIGVPVGTLRQWEQGRRQPTGAARVLLALIDRNPSIVRETLIPGSSARSRRPPRAKRH